MKKETESGERYDSLFMGLYLGMPEKDFYTHCWQLNKKGLVRQGTGNTTVQYIAKSEFKHTATMDFYPYFKDGKIAGMPVQYSYTGWAPWNKELSSEELQKELLSWHRKVYGKGFIEVRHRTRGSAFIKIDGNRQIAIFKKDQISVWVVFTDLHAVKNQSEFLPDSLNTKNDTIPKPAIK